MYRKRGAHGRPQRECVHNYAFWIWRAGTAGQLQPDVGTAELVVWPLQILSWSLRPDQTVPITSSLNLASPSLPGDSGIQRRNLLFRGKVLYRLLCTQTRGRRDHSRLAEQRAPPALETCFGVPEVIYL